MSAGSDKWLDLELWTDTCQCLKTLKGRGYRIAVTCMDQLGEGRETLPIHKVRRNKECGFGCEINVGGLWIECRKLFGYRGRFGSVLREMFSWSDFWTAHFQ